MRKRVGNASPQEGADALQISLNAIHGRVFFVQFGLDTLQSWLASAELVLVSLRLPASSRPTD
jgi:hypothetical protein